MGEVVHRARASGDGELAVAEVHIFQLQSADGSGSGGVDGREYKGEAGGGAADGLDGAVHLLVRQGLQDGVLERADFDAGGRIAKDDAVLLRPAEQRPQGDERLVALVPVEDLGVGEDVVTGDFAPSTDGSTDATVYGFSATPVDACPVTF